MKNFNFEMIQQFEGKNKKLVKTIDIFSHGYRINGVCDIYKHGFCVLDLINKIYHKFDNEVSELAFVLKFIQDNEPRKTFNQVNKDKKPTYKSFSKNKVKSDWRPENYHWDNSISETSEDSLYFIKDTLGRIKIGRSINPEKRVKGLQTSTSSTIKLVFAVLNKGCMEKRLHSCFSELHVRGEWFTYTTRFDDFFAYISDKTPELVIKQQSMVLQNRT